MTLVQQRSTGTWRADAACLPHPPEWWINPTPAEPYKAIAICETCPVTRECAQARYLIDAPGVWAGVKWVPAAKKGTKIDTRIHPEYRGTTKVARRQNARRRRVVTWYQRGWPIAEIAKKVGCHRDTVRADLKAVGVQLESEIRRAS